jgi:hypothetical protein
MSLVAVVRREGDQPGRLPATRVVPVGLPEDLEFSSYFMDLSQETGILSSLGTAPMAGADFLMACSSPPTRSKSLRLRSFFSSARQLEEKRESLPVPGDPLVELASVIEPDGGMPGSSLTERALRTILTLLCFRAGERILQRGIFTRHSKRMVTFLRGLDPDRISELHRDQIELGLVVVEDPNFDWEAWQDVAEQLTGDQKLKEKQLEQMLSSVVASHAMSGGSKDPPKV